MGDVRMLWAGRIISWVFLVTGGFTWTVGQAGLDVTNRNLCDLVSSISSWSITNCHVSNWLVWLWGFGVVGALLFLIIDAIRWLQKRIIHTPQSGKVGTSGKITMTEALHLLNNAREYPAFEDSLYQALYDGGIQSWGRKSLSRINESELGPYRTIPKDYWLTGRLEWTTIGPGGTERANCPDDPLDYTRIQFDGQEIRDLARGLAS
jgi:hypothetical protein